MYPREYSPTDPNPRNTASIAWNPPDPGNTGPNPRNTAPDPRPTPQSSYTIDYRGN